MPIKEYFTHYSFIDVSLDDEKNFVLHTLAWIAILWKLIFASIRPYVDS